MDGMREYHETQRLLEAKRELEETLRLPTLSEEQRARLLENKRQVEETLNR